MHNGTTAHRSELELRGETIWQTRYMQLGERTILGGRLILHELSQRWRSFM